ncbi:hypothetical protein [Acrocarpospora phusangensis]|uniref:hypothetical protein n=1 Tax=Acrocarpospora phusangensis TaxID=1070424 RepID=UPI0019526341|nr:hypothetical protein [Acrocarpospora phusangensis]
MLLLSFVVVAPASAAVFCYGGGMIHADLVDDGTGQPNRFIQKFPAVIEFSTEGFERVQEEDCRQATLTVQHTILASGRSVSLGTSGSTRVTVTEADVSIGGGYPYCRICVRFRTIMMDGVNAAVPMYDSTGTSGYFPAPATPGADYDGDGVDDGDDSCPSEPGPASNNGCPDGSATPSPSPSGEPSAEPSPSPTCQAPAVRLEQALDGDGVALTATVEFSTDPAGFDYQWRQVSGPGTATFGPTLVASLGRTVIVSNTVRFSQRGAHVLEFTAAKPGCSTESEIRVGGIEIRVDTSDAHGLLEGTVAPATGECPVTLTVKSTRDAQVWNGVVPSAQSGAALPPRPETRWPRVVNPNGAALLGPDAYGTLTWPGACLSEPDQFISFAYDITDQAALNMQAVEIVTKILSMGWLSQTGLQNDLTKIAAFQRALRGDAKKLWECVAGLQLRPEPSGAFLCAMSPLVGLINDPPAMERLVDQLAALGGGFYVTEETRRAWEAVTKLDPVNLAKYLRMLTLEYTPGFAEQEADEQKKEIERLTTIFNTDEASQQQAQRNLTEHLEKIKTARADLKAAKDYTKAEQALAKCLNRRNTGCPAEKAALNSARLVLVPIAQKYGLPADSAVAGRISALIDSMDRQTDVLKQAIRQADEVVAVSKAALKEANRVFASLEKMAVVAEVLDPVLEIVEQSFAYYDAHQKGITTGAIYFVACGPGSRKPVCVTR